MRLERPYLCEACQVYGRGEECWSCGNTFLTWGRQPVLNSGAAGPDFSMSPQELQSSVSPDWQTPLIDPMTLYAEGHVPG